jgi:hypothetical protein
MQLKPSLVYSFVGVFGVLGVLFYPRPLTLYPQAAASLPLGDANYRLQKTTTSRSLPYTFCVLHENERNAKNNVMQFLRETGGQVWELKAQGERNVTFFIKKKKFSFDPNRIFTAPGVANTLVMHSRNQPTSEARTIVGDFAQRIKDSLFSQTPNPVDALIVSVHNNTDGAYSALSHLPDSTNAEGVRDIFINSFRDPDDFFYVTRRFDFNYLKMLGYNVILQDNKFVKDDGSLSVYCGKRKIRYINVEAEYTHHGEQMDMLNTVHNLLKKVVIPNKPLAKMADKKPKTADSTAATTTEKPIEKDSNKANEKQTSEPIQSEMQEDAP